MLRDQPRAANIIAKVFYKIYIKSYLIEILKKNY